MVSVVTKIQIDRPPKEVAAYATNPDHATEWYINIKSVEWQTSKPLSIGSQIAFTAEFLGKKLSYVYEVVEFVPFEKLVMRTADGPFPMETTYTWEKTDNGQTLMTLRNRGKPRGFSRWFAPFMKMAMRNANSKDLKMLKQILESDK